MNAATAAPSSGHFPIHEMPRLLHSIYWELSGSRVLTMDYSKGRHISAEYPSDAETRTRSAQTFARLLLSQIFEHGFFHGDMHPGNVFCCRTDLLS